MPVVKRLHPEAPWVQLEITDHDWDQADPNLLLTMFVELHLIRAFEEMVLTLANDGLVHGPAHSSIGQEGTAVGACAALAPSDAVNGSHRGHHQFLAKALNYVTKGQLHPTDVTSKEVREVLYRTLAEILGLSPGYCHGRGGSMHLQWMQAGALGTNAIVGGGVPMAAGNAFAQRHAGTKDVTLAFFGDGAINIGSVLETLNLAAAWNLPLAFVCENNMYAVSTSVKEATREARLSARGPGFGIPSWTVDGMDPLAVQIAMTAALKHMRSGKGPVFIETKTYRFFHQNGGYPGSAFGYRTTGEERHFQERDPLLQMKTHLLALGLIDKEGVDTLRANAVALMEEIASTLTEENTQGRTRGIIPSLWPDPAFCDVGIRNDLANLDQSNTIEEYEYNGPRKEVSFIEAVAAVMNRAMETNEDIVVLGEDVHHLKGGTNGATKGLVERFPDRVLGTPISENAFVGLAGGMALDGRFRPVVEFMYPDFLWVAADQLFNQIGKARHMFGGDNAVPLVLRTKVAIGTGYGSQHSMDPAGIFATSPGWRIMAPSTPHDYVGMMNAALAIGDPVLVIEHVELYPSRGMIPLDHLDYQIPFAKAALRTTGDTATVLTYLSMVEVCLAAAAETGVDIDLVDLRFLDRASLDWETVGESIKKTNAVLIVEQGALGTSWGSWLADELQHRFFDWLDQPISRVTGSEASPSISKVLERQAFPDQDGVAKALLRMRANSGQEVR